MLKGMCSDYSSSLKYADVTMTNEIAGNISITLGSMSAWHFLFLV